MTSFRLTVQRRHASWLPLRKLILHSILGIDIPIPVPRITGASLAPGTATIGDGTLRVPSESAYEQLDTDYINKSFVGAAGSRSLRDGLGFLNWVESFFDITKH